MKQWFYIEKDERKGPVSEEQLKELFTRGKLSEATMVWEEGLEEWSKADSIEGLVPTALMPPPIPPKAPQEQTAQHTPPPMPGNRDDDSAIFYYIPTNRLIGMSILSGGLFQFYWIYRNWKYLNDRYNLNIQPLARTIFAIFFVRSLFRTIKADEELNKTGKASFSANTLAIGWIILMFLSGTVGQGTGLFTAFLSLMISLPTIAFFLPVQSYINSANDAENPNRSYDPFTLGQYVCLGVGFLLMFMGMTMSMV